MHLEFEYIKMHINNQEANAIFYALIDSIKSVIGDTHYQKHNQYFYDSRNTTMSIAECLGERLGMKNIYLDAVKDAEAWIKSKEQA